MVKRILLLAALALFSGGTAMAQEDAPQATSNGGAGIRAGNIAATGKTMPMPGASNGAGVTGLDRGIKNEDNKITNSICKGC